MQFDAEDFFYLDKIRDALAANFVGFAGIKDVYWLPLLNVMGKGKFKWRINVQYVVEGFQEFDTFDKVYERETTFYDEFPGVLWGFQTTYLKHYESLENLQHNMEHSGYMSVNTVKEAGGK